MIVTSWSERASQTMWGPVEAETDLQHTFDLPKLRRRDSEVNPIARTRLRMLWWLLCWLALSTVNLVGSIIIPYIPSTVVSAGCLLAASYVAKGAFEHSTEVLMRAIKGLVPVCLIILINYIALAESVDIDHFTFDTEDALERYVIEHPIDNFAVHVCMVVDLLLIGGGLLLAEACFDFIRCLRGEAQSSRPRILELFKGFETDENSEAPQGSFAATMFPRACSANRNSGRCSPTSLSGISTMH